MRFTVPTLLLTTLLLSAGCIPEALNIRRISKGQISSSANLSSVKIVDNKLIISGQQLEDVSKISIRDPSNVEKKFSIESSSNTQLIATSNSNVSFSIGSVVDLILSSAHASNVFQIAFNLENGSVKGSHINHMNARPGQVMRFNGVKWEPADVAILKTSRVRSFINQQESADSSISSNHSDNCDASETYVAFEGINDEDGFPITDQGFCIETTPRVAQSWLQAKTACENAGKRLPREFEWIMACSRRLDLGVSLIGQNWEWISNYKLDAAVDSYHLTASMPFDGECATESLFIPQSASNSGYNLSYRCAK